jgi:hypothetical protein
MLHQPSTSGLHHGKAVKASFAGADKSISSFMKAILLIADKCNTKRRGMFNEAGGRAGAAF